MPKPRKHDANLSPPPKWKAGQPFNSLPELPPAVELETRAVLKACITARAAVAALKQAAQLIPNQAMLVNTLPMLESQASTAIENIVTTTDKLFQHQHRDDHADPATKEALRYSQAMFEGFRSLEKKPLTTKTAEEICSKIKGRSMKVRNVPGTALANESGEVVYTPPVGEDLLRSLLSNWEKFIHNEQDLDPLVRMAVGHYQFEAIHPFTDGNGRTGRVLNSLFLINEKLLSLPILYLSSYIIDNKDDYYRLLMEITTKNNWEEWLLFIIKGVEKTAERTKSKIEAIRLLFDHTSEYSRSQLGRTHSYELVSLIFELPYCRIQDVVDADIAGRQAASRQLKQLVECEVLTDMTIGREKLFVHPKLLKLLTKKKNKFKPYSNAGQNE